SVAALKAVIESQFSALHTNLIDRGHIGFNWSSTFASSDPLPDPPPGEEAVPPSEFLKTVKKASSRESTYEPYLLRIIFTNHITRAALANNDTKLLKYTVQQADLAHNAPPVLIPAPARVALWFGMGTYGQFSTWHQDPNTITCFVNDQDQIQIPVGRITPIQSPFFPGLFDAVTVNLSGLGLSAGDQISLQLVVFGQTVSGKAVKKALPGATLQATTVKFVNVPVNKQISAVIHEIGHAFNMVANDDSSLDRPSTYYSNNGDHCSQGLATEESGDYHRETVINGATVTAQAKANNADCVMFGLIGGLPSPRQNFCNICEPIFKKIDISAGVN
ncbi:MAG: hypothetical protein ABG776_17575, partial [Cyanobacteria bacterium J06555_13]